GGDTQSVNLMLGYAYLLLNSPEWRGSILTIKSLVKSDEERSGTTDYLTKFLHLSRLTAELDIQTIGQNVVPLSVINESSLDADLVFLGMRPPTKEETAEEYSKYYS